MSKSPPSGRAAGDLERDFEEGPAVYRRCLLGGHLPLRGCRGKGQHVAPQSCCPGSSRRKGLNLFCILAGFIRSQWHARDRRQSCGVPSHTQFDPQGPPATVTPGWLLASLSGANPDRY